MRTFENKPGVTFDPTKTTVIYAEDMNEIVSEIEALQEGGVGSQILTGAGAPATELGSDGDLYINTSNGDVYKKVTGAWGAPVMNITGAEGPQGAQGAQGPQGDDGAQGPQGPAGPANEMYVATEGATTTFDIDANGGNQRVALTGNRTLAVTCTTNRPFILTLIQDGTGSRTVTWFNTIAWAGGTVPTLTTTANKRDVFGFLRTGTATYLGFVIGKNV